MSDTSANVGRIYECLFKCIPQDIRDSCGVLLWISQGGRSLRAFKPEACREWWPRSQFETNGVAKTDPFQDWAAWVSADEATGQSQTNGNHDGRVAAMLQVLAPESSGRPPVVAWVRWRDERAEGKTSVFHWKPLIGGGHTRDPEPLGLGSQRLEADPGFTQKFGCIAMFFPRFGNEPRGFDSPAAWISAGLWTHILDQIRGVLAISSFTRSEARVSSAASRLPPFFGLVLGESPQIVDIREQIRKVAATNSLVMINGETGTGKECVAQAIHANSDRKGGEFLAINVSMLSTETMASQLFGHVKGAFTGADRNHKGFFVTATDGTLFLDEIGDMPPDVQKSLLRVLESKAVHPLGAERPVSVGTRVIAATNRDLALMVRNKEFRQDLYYRLDVFTIKIPPLRERLVDLPVLLDHLIGMVAAERGSKAPAIGPGVLELLTTKAWPGNVRELRNAVERAMVLARDEPCLTVDLFAGRPLADDKVYSVAPPPSRAESVSIMDEHASCAWMHSLPLSKLLSVAMPKALDDREKECIGERLTNMRNISPKKTWVACAAELGITEDRLNIWLSAVGLHAPRRPKSPR